MSRGSPARRAEMMRLRASGLRLREIADRYGTTKSNISWIIKRERERRGEVVKRKTIADPDVPAWSAGLHPRLAGGVDRILVPPGDMPAADVAALCARHDDLWWARRLRAEKDWLGPRRFVQLCAWASALGHPIPSNPDGFPKELVDFSPAKRRIYED